MNCIKTYAFYCADCKIPHRTYDDATKCCLWPPKRGVAYSCAVCGALYETAIEADSCCSDIEDEL